MNSAVGKQIVAVDGVRSPVQIGGRATNPREAVVFVHGNNAGADWTPLITPIAEFARVVAPDMPGFGEADKPVGWPYTVTAYAAHLGGILEQLGIERVHLVAHDFGGPFALGWAAGHLDAVASMTLLNTPVEINHFAARLWRTPVVGEVFNWAAGARFARHVTRRLNPSLPDAPLDEMVRQAMVPETKRAVLRLYRSTGKHAIVKYIDQLAHFAGEVLIVSGEQDFYIPIEQAEQQRRIFRHARVVPVPGAGHFAWLEQPGRVVGCVTEFLRAQTAKSSVHG